MTRSQIKSRLTADPDIQRLAKEAEARFDDYRNYLTANDDILDPAQASKHYAQLIHEASNPAELRAAQAMKAEIEISAEDVRNAAKKLARAEYKPAGEALMVVVERGKEILTALVDDAVLAETEFFQAHDLPVEATSVRFAPQQVLAEFAQFERQLNHTGNYSGSGLPSPRSPILEWLK